MADDSRRPISLGASGLKVSKLWLGAMMFGDQTDTAEAARIVAATRDAGLNAIDTADAYANGESERIVGRLIAADRERWGETPAAWIVARDGARIDAEAVRAWANERLGKTQRIAFLEVVDELPRSAIGKILKRELRDRFVATRLPSSGASHG